MYAPGGIASLIVQNMRLVKYGKFSAVFPQLLAVCIGTLLSACGIVVMVEMFYHVSLDAANGSVMQLGGFAVDTLAYSGWTLATAISITGASVFLMAKGPFQQAWSDAHADIELLIRKAQA